MKKLQLILMPGMDGSGFLYQPLSQFLSDKGLDHVIEPLNPYADKKAYIKYLEHKYHDQSVVLIAESYSGHIATELALAGNLKIRKIVIMASFLENPTNLTELEKYLSMDIIKNPFIPDKALGFALFGNNSNKVLIDLFKKAMQDVTTEQLASRIRDMRSLKLPKKTIEIPTLYIQASHDWLVPAKNYLSYEKVFRNITLSKLEGTHLIAQGKAQECCKLISDYLEA